jgi:hypothetical protein
VTASEFAFLTLGLVLGVATGAALIEVMRSRPTAKREVRVTVAPNSIARRRATTLADPEANSVAAGPARGGPADRRWVDRDMPVDDPPPAAPAALPGAVGSGRSAWVADPPYDRANRTPVPGGPPFRLAGAGGGAPIGISISHEPDPMMTALRASAAASARVLMPSGIESSAVSSAVPAARADQRRPVGTMAGPTPRPGEATLQEQVGADERAEQATSERALAEQSTGEGPAGGRGAGDAPAQGEAAERADAIAGACDEPKRIADERCLVATRARDGAAGALEALRSAQRAYDEHASQAETHAATADPRAVRSAKEAAQQAFRVAREAGRTRDDVEAAARDWLTEINRINLATREASALAERHRLAASELASNLERLAVEADAARISAESAEEACVAAREAVAACQEAAAVLAARGKRSAPPVAAPPLERGDEALQLRDPSMASRAGEDAVIIQLLRGDREALGRLVAKLGGDDPEERRRWQTSIGELLEAFVARSIEASAFDFPTEHSFWGPFTRSQCRDIAAALASLGYKHDGFGSWADDRMPTQRDLSLAVGYAGLDPMRIRHWPTETEMHDLLREVTVAADEYVWEAAGTLTLGELVSLLGRRADSLTELWNEWGIVRPLLLAAE